MAVCSWCNLEMTDPATTTCPQNQEVEFPGGGSLPSVPFEALPPMSAEEWMAEWRKHSSPGASDEEARKRCEAYLTSQSRCHDCRVEAGGRHHPGCDSEKCPKCGGQLISCGCLDDVEE